MELLAKLLRAHAEAMLEYSIVYELEMLANDNVTSAHTKARFAAGLVFAHKAKAILEEAQCEP